jgi:hypothetical protein
MLTQAQPIEITKKKRGLCHCVSKNAGGAAKWGEFWEGEEGQRGALKTPKTIWNPSVFQNPIFSLFFLLTYSFSISLKSITYTLAAPLKTSKYVKNRGTNPDTRFPQPVDSIKLFLCQHFAPSDTSGTRAGTNPAPSKKLQTVQQSLVT